MHEERVIQALCYGIAQGEKLRIANWLKEWGEPVNSAALPPPDDNIVQALGEGLATPGEHLSGCFLAVAELRECGVMVEALEDVLLELDKAYYKRRPMGLWINSARLEVLRIMRRLQENGHKTLVATVIANVAQFGIDIDLDGELNETQKP